MALDLVDYEQKAHEAVKAFWGNREAARQKQIESGKKHLAIFYGAAHLPDMEQRLLKQGFKLQKSEWLKAWDLPAE